MTNTILFLSATSLAALIGLSRAPTTTMMPSSAVEACAPVGGRLVDAKVGAELADFGLSAASPLAPLPAPASTQNPPGGGFCTTSGGAGEPGFCSVETGTPEPYFCTTKGAWAVNPCSVNGGANYFCSIQDGGGEAGSFQCTVNNGAGKFCSVSTGGQQAPNYCSTFGGSQDTTNLCSVWGGGECSVSDTAGGKAECSVFFGDPDDGSACSAHGASAGSCSVHPGSNDHKCTSDTPGACSAQGGAPDGNCSVIGGGGHREEGEDGSLWCYGAPPG